MTREYRLIVNFLGTIFLNVMVAGCSHSYNTSEEINSERSLREAGEQFGMDAEAPMPESSQVDVTLNDGEKLNHETVVLGISCSAHTYVNSLQTAIERYLSAYDHDQMLGQGASPIRADLTVKNAYSSIRCFLVGSYDSACIAKVGLTLEGTLYQDEKVFTLKPLVVSIEEKADKQGWSCSNMGKIVGVLDQRAGSKIAQKLSEDVKKIISAKQAGL